MSTAKKGLSLHQFERAWAAKARANLKQKREEERRARARQLGIKFAPLGKARAGAARLGVTRISPPKDNPEAFRRADLWRTRRAQADANRILSYHNDLIESGLVSAEEPHFDLPIRTDTSLRRAA